MSTKHTDEEKRIRQERAWDIISNVFYVFTKLCGVGAIILLCWLLGQTV